MELLCFSLSFCSSLKPRFLTTLITNVNSGSNWRSEKREHKVKPHVLLVSAFSYQKFIHFALNETKSRTFLLPSPLQEKYSSMAAMDGRMELQMLSFEAPKIRLLRSLSIENETMQVLQDQKFMYPYFAPTFSPLLA